VKVAIAASGLMAVLLIGQQISFNAQNRAELRGYRQGYEQGCIDTGNAISNKLILELKMDTPK